MRQAGRYLPEYRAVRERADFLTMVGTPELAVEVTLQPVDRLGVDAAIIFSDILVVPQAMGMALSVDEGVGPRFHHPLRAPADFERVRDLSPAEDLRHVLDALRLARRKLEDRVPLIGFAGAPWTLASYMIEGGGSKSFAEIKTLAYREPQVLHALLDKLASTVSSYLLFQIESGAQVIQLFDTWAGELNRSDYEEFALPYTQRIFQAIGTRVPRILYLNGCSAILESMADSGADVISIDWRISIADAKQRVGDRVALQGNLDPCVLLGPEDRIFAKTREILEQAGPVGHILNLGHGILPPTPVENARSFIKFGQSYRHSQ